MDNRKKCTICKNIFDGEDAAVLTMSGFGNARYICPDCEELIDTATGSRDYEEITAAIGKLGERASVEISDTLAFNAFAEIIGSASERAEKIKSGEYDFSLDEAEEEGFDEIPEELRETEEDKALDEKEAKVGAVIEKVTSWICGAMIAAVVLFFIYRLIF